jgi:hypothetical protein
MVYHEMTEYWALVIVAVISLIGTVSGSYLAQRKTTALISYRLEQLEKKVDKHNGVIERTYLLEKKCDVYEEKFRVANRRIDDLEKERGKVS